MGEKLLALRIREAVSFFSGYFSHSTYLIFGISYRARCRTNVVHVYPLQPSRSSPKFPSFLSLFSVVSFSPFVSPRGVVGLSSPRTTFSPGLRPLSSVPFCCRPFLPKDRKREVVRPRAALALSMEAWRVCVGEGSAEGIGQYRQRA